MKEIGFGIIFGMMSFATFAATPFNGYIVKLKPGAAFINLHPFSSVVDVKKTLQTSFGTFVHLNLLGSVENSFINQLSQNPDIEYIEPNYLISIERKETAEESPPPKDLSFKKQWGMKNDGKNGILKGSGVAGEDINILRAWNITKGSTDIKIAVIDSGVDYTHPDLKDQIDINQAELNGLPGVDDDENGYVDDIYGYDFANKDGDPEDSNGHGTHCAGIIGASHNLLGIAGVMAKVKIVPIKFISDQGSGETIDAISSIDYAIKRGVRVMSNSWGSEEEEQSLQEAIVAAETAGITFVAAAGNNAADNDVVKSFPANYKVSNVISVGAFTSSGVKSSFSNYGQKSVHVTAPGTNILSTYKNGSFAPLSGTSMAAPHVAGIVGLLLSHEPDLSPLQIRERLVKTSTKNAKLNTASISGGRVDAYRALTNK